MSSNLQPNTKRKRETPVNDDAPREVERSTQFWFDDGNVVLQTQTMQFRVHRSLLSLHSPIMKDCFACPQPGDAPLLEGCPLVHLPDPTKDIENFCALLYGVYHLDVDGINYAYLETMMYMGRKYGISHFTASALKHLQKLFPPTLKAWDNGCSGIKKMASENEGLLFDVINLAYEYRVASILPAAFLSLCTIHKLDEILSGIERPNHHRPLAALNHQPMLDCMRARMTFIPSFICGIVNFMEGDDLDDESKIQYIIPTARCTKKTSCQRRFVDVLTRLIGLSSSIYCIKFPRRLDVLCFSLEDISDPFCRQCEPEMQKTFDTHIKTAWDELPGHLHMSENFDV
ncbi:hypothetical protein HYPSUDRAFT_36368 [Hypholoma sublateritium FD-334 SS-4]|uniref:BTB domain-containing protein n=1 Tax=Hypholoma sublateritium (strain FD-334 SS-4) TaxID=945553 RepID=A0A0D2LGB9_HYPSF|nr:hypothetical protein HYPSUDRAFT_36368 [Hypholoma sublateritium FD-334 SS-4]